MTDLDVGRWTWRQARRVDRLHDLGGLDRDDGLAREAVGGEQSEDGVVVIAVVVETADPGRIGRAGVRKTHHRDDDDDEQEHAAGVTEPSYNPTHLDYPALSRRVHR